MPAFPAQFSINNIAAHYNAVIDDQTKFKKGDLVKFDHGVQINGAIADTAVTIDLGKNQKSNSIRILEVCYLWVIVARPNEFFR